jgi:hypothetical protein
VVIAIADKKVKVRVFDYTGPNFLGMYSLHKIEEFQGSLSAQDLKDLKKKLTGDED